MLLPSLLMFLLPAKYELQLQSLYLSLWLLSWCHHGRMWERYKLNSCVSVRMWIHRSGSWF